MPVKNTTSQGVLARNQIISVSVLKQSLCFKPLYGLDQNLAIHLQDFIAFLLWKNSTFVHGLLKQENSSIHDLVSALTKGLLFFYVVHSATRQWQGCSKQERQIKLANHQQLATFLRQETVSFGPLARVLTGCTPLPSITRLDSLLCPEILISASGQASPQTYRQTSTATE